MKRRFGDGTRTLATFNQKLRVAREQNLAAKTAAVESELDAITNTGSTVTTTETTVEAPLPSLPPEPSFYERYKTYILWGGGGLVGLLVLRKLLR